MRAVSRWLSFAVVVAGLSACTDPTLQRPALGLSVSDTAFDFGVIALGSAPAKTLTLTNGGAAQLTVSTVVAPPPFKVRDFPATGIVLGAGESFVLKVAFAPGLEGVYGAALSVTADDGEGPHVVSLSGRAVKATVAVAPGEEVDFGDVTIGSAGVRNVVLSNTSDVDAAVTLRIDGFDGASFSSPEVGGALPLVVAAHAEHTLSVSFHPDHLGFAEGWLHVSPCEGCTETNVALHGTGVASCIGVDPVAVEFGTVEIGSSGTATMVVQNKGNRAIDLTDAFLSATSSAEFALQGFTPGKTVSLAAGARLPLTVTFNPQARGDRDGSVRLRASSSAQSCFAEVRVHGVGGGGCLDVSPGTIDFGTIAATMTREARVFVANTSCGADVRISGVQVSGDAEFAADTLRPAPFLLKQGEVAEVSVSFSPSQKGEYAASLTLAALDASNRPLAKQPLPVKLTGKARELAPCSFSVTPAKLDFGAVNVGTTTALAAKIVNTGQDACYLSNIELEAGTDAAFTLKDGSVPGLLLDAGKSAAIMVKFTPTQLGAVNGAVSFGVSDPANPSARVSITGRAVQGCLSVQPADLDFGTAIVGCTPAMLSFTVTNVCAGDAQLKSVAIGSGTSNEFTFSSNTLLPKTLSSGSTVQVNVSYTPVDDGLDSVPLFVSDGTDGFLVSAHGNGAANPTRTDRFVQADKEKVDVLLVLDNSGSMSEEQDAISRNFASFITYARSRGIDYHVGVTTTGIDPSPGGWSVCPGGVDGGEAGRLFPADGSSPRVITTTTLNADQVFAKNVKVGTCHWLEQGFEAAYRALSPPLVDHADDPRSTLANDGNLGFLRDDARLAIVFVSDEDDQSPETVSYYLSFFQALKKNDPALLSVSAIVGPADLNTCQTASASGARYMEMADKTGGFKESICTADWAASLDKIGRNAFGGRTTFPLSGKPADPAKVVVTVNGAVVTAGASTWKYDGMGNAVVFTQTALPAPGAKIEITYPLGCP